MLLVLDNQNMLEDLAYEFDIASCCHFSIFKVPGHFY